MADFLKRNRAEVVKMCLFEYDVEKQREFDREEGKQVLIVNMKKNKKFQKEQLTGEGYADIVDCYADRL